MMDEAMRLTGAAYLRSVLRPTLAAVLAERRPCEIDPARVKPSAAVTANLANLKDYVERVSTLPLRYESDIYGFGHENHSFRFSDPMSLVSLKKWSAYFC